VEVVLVPVLVGDHHDRLLHLLVNLFEEVEHHPGVLRIEVGTGFISEQDVGLVHDRPGDRDPLLLATGEFPGEVILPVEHPNLREDIDACIVILLLRQILPEHRRQGDILHHREIGHQRIVLEDVPEPVEPEHRLLVVVQPGDIRPVDHDPAAVRSHEPGDHFQYGRLTRTVPAEQYVDVLVFDRHVYIQDIVP